MNVKLTRRGFIGGILATIAAATVKPSLSLAETGDEIVKIFPNDRKFNYSLLPGDTLKAAWIDGCWVMHATATCTIVSFAKTASGRVLAVDKREHTYWPMTLVPGKQTIHKSTMRMNWWRRDRDGER